MKNRDALTALPVLPAHVGGTDWIIDSDSYVAGVYRTSDPREVAISNGLVSRTFRLAPNGAAVGLDNLMRGEAMLRAVNPEARLSIDGAGCEVGGLIGQEEYAYLKSAELEKMTADPNSFQFTGFEIDSIKERFPWKRVRHSADLPWPPKGKTLALKFAPPANKLPGVTVLVHYEIYDGIPLICKWLTLRNDGKQSIHLDMVTSEILSVPESSVEVAESGAAFNGIFAVTDYKCLATEIRPDNRVIRWVVDPRYTDQVNYELVTPCTLESCLPVGPDVDIQPGEVFESQRTWELIYDSTDKERCSLARRRMCRTISPWATENPIMMHVRKSDFDSVKLAVDQCAEVGFEMVILTFGSGVDLRNMSPENLGQLKKLADYAHSKGVELGAYDLLASSSVSAEVDVIDPKTGKPGGAIFGASPCLRSQWGLDYLENLKQMFTETGLNLLEHDGSYPGDVCASTKHVGHKGLSDSQWLQFRQISEFYRWCLANGIYLNIPDWYFLQGGTKTAMGYRETNFSLPRERQIMLCRQNIYDGTWEKTPSMGWMFVPLVQYQGGGEAATIEPLSEHLDTYEAHLTQNFGSGVQACYRGPRLYDTDQTRALVKKWVDFYKKHRAILESDIIHVRRPDGRNIDAILHVDPRPVASAAPLRSATEASSARERGLAMVYNPLDRKVKTTLRLPLYYTGLTDTAAIREQEGKPKRYKLDRDYGVDLPIAIPPKSATWFVIE